MLLELSNWQCFWASMVQKLAFAWSKSCDGELAWTAPDLMKYISLDTSPSRITTSSRRYTCTMHAAPATIKPMRIRLRPALS